MEPRPGAPRAAEMAAVDDGAGALLRQLLDGRLDAEELEQVAAHLIGGAASESEQWHRGALRKAKRALAKQDGLATEWVDRLCRDDDPAVVAAAAGNPAASPCVLARIAAVLVLGATNSARPLGRGDIDLCVALVRNPATPATVRGDLSGLRNAYVDEASAASLLTPPDSLENLARVFLRATVSAKARRSPWALGEWVAANPNTPRPVAVEMAIEAATGIVTCPAVVAASLRRGDLQSTDLTRIAASLRAQADRYAALSAAAADAVNERGTHPRAPFEVRLWRSETHAGRRDLSGIIASDEADDADAAVEAAAALLGASSGRSDVSSLTERGDRSRIEPAVAAPFGALHWQVWPHTMHPDGGWTAAIYRVVHTAEPPPGRLIGGANNETEALAVIAEDMAGRLRAALESLGAGDLDPAMWRQLPEETRRGVLDRLSDDVWAYQGRFAAFDAALSGDATALAQWRSLSGDAGSVVRCFDAPGGAFVEVSGRLWATLGGPSPSPAASPGCLLAAL